MDTITSGFKSMALLAGLAGLLHCGGPGLGPSEPALNETSCSRCRMSISQLRFSSQLVERGGTVEFFDDLGCLLAWIRESGIPDGSAIFVADFRTGEWLRAEEAEFFQNAGVPSPMGSGLIAVRSGEEAQAVASEIGGPGLTWQEVLTIHG